MFKNRIAFLMLVCVVNGLWCMNEQELGYSAFHAFVHRSPDNPAIIYPIAEQCHHADPLLSRHEFINCFRPAVGGDGHQRAAVFPLSVINKLWNSYVELSNPALVRSQFRDEYSTCSWIGYVNEGHDFAYSGHATSNIFDNLYKRVCNLFGAGYQVNKYYHIARFNFDVAIGPFGMPVLASFNLQASRLESSLANGYDIIILADHNHSLDIIFANHNITFIISRVNAYQSHDNGQIQHAIDEAISNGRIKRFNSLANAINAYKNSLA